jgi:hypothetical protein
MRPDALHERRVRCAFGEDQTLQGGLVSNQETFANRA